MPEVPKETELNEGAPHRSPAPAEATSAGGESSEVDDGADVAKPRVAPSSADESIEVIEEVEAVEEVDEVEVIGVVNTKAVPSQAPRLPGPALANSGASQLPPAPPEAISAIAAAVGRLRAEVAATADRSRKARLLHEAAEIQERGGDESGAARDYLAAYNADTRFREPLEGLVRLLERRRSASNLGKLIEALVASAETPEERARALTQRALFFEDVQKDLEGARGVAREATETGARAADLGPAWLALEMVASKLGDATLREDALAGRAELTDDATWKGLLLVDVAALAASSGDVDRALQLLARVRENGGGASYIAAASVDHVVRGDPGLPDSDEARARSQKLAEALEAQASMIHSAMTDANGGDAKGVPLYVRSVEFVVDRLLRAADVRRTAGEIEGSAALVDRSLGILYESAGGAKAGGLLRAPLVDIERLLLTERLRLAELSGNRALTAELAEKRSAGETDGGVRAALAIRIAEHAIVEGDHEKAIEALTRATLSDPASSPARALKIDVIEEASSDATRLPIELEDLARQYETMEGRGRALVLAAHLWATRAENGARAREALRQAEDCGVPKETIARLGRSLASLRSDRTWYEDATRMLASHLASRDDAAELPFLWIELARIRLAQGDETGVTKATAALRELPSSAWLGRVLEGLASPELDRTRARSAIEELTAGVVDTELRRSLTLVCALRAHEEGDEKGAVFHLEALAKEEPGDPLVTAYLGDLLRRANDHAGAARLATAAAAAIESSGDDPERAAARHLDAGFEQWRLGELSVAVAHFETAAEFAPEAARSAVTWGARGIDVDTVDGRRRALDVAGADSGVALERFALEATFGDPDDAGAALDAVAMASNDPLRLAAALARLVWPRSSDDQEKRTDALDLLARASESSKAAAAAEHLRLMRDEDADASTLVEAAKAWLDAGGGTAAAIEWLAGAMASGDPSLEVDARRALAELSSDESREAFHASAALLSFVLSPDEPPALVAGTSHAARLANLELSPAGSDPRRRAAALADLDGALGEQTENDALGLAGWSSLAAGEPAVALDVFRTVTTKLPDELHAWEGMRAAAEELGDSNAYAIACEQLGARSADSGRGGAFWEQAALAWLELGAPFEARAERALEASFARDATRPVAFDRLFRRVRDRKDHDKLLALIDRRLASIDDPREVAKMHWEQARALREKGDSTGALEALAHVTRYDENHVGALALTGEIFIRRGMFVEAADQLARLARVEAAPAKNRVTAGVAAVDLYENKLGRHDLALEVLVALHRAHLTTLPVRERLARAAARTGSWVEATSILEQLMNERPDQKGRIDAARLALAIHRDRMMAPASALSAASKLLAESPTDGEALDLVIDLNPSVVQRRSLLERGRDALIMSLHETPHDLDGFHRLARIARELGDNALEQAALSGAVALGGRDGSSEQLIARYSSKKPRLPQLALTEPMFRQLLAPGDDGPIANLFVALGPTIGKALGPSRETLGVTRKDRVDPKAGIALRAEIAAWAGAFGVTEFDLYVGGKDPSGVTGVSGDPPAIIVGPDVNAPLSPTTRARLARELVSIVRGTTIARWRDDATIAAIVVTACTLTKVPVEAPPFAVLAEVERLIGKAISRKTKAIIEPICRAWVASGIDARKWVLAARSTHARAAVLASGDVSVVLADISGEPDARLRTHDDARVGELLRFVLSRPYFDLRRSLGLEVNG